MTSNEWKKCSSCKKSINLGAKYYVCNVTTCQHKRRGFQFCSVGCWDAHVPIMRHKDSWAEDRIAPLQPEESTPETAERKVFRNTPSSSSAPATSINKKLPQDTLIVVSKLKHFIKELCDYNTSGDVVDHLSDHIRKLCIQASKRAQEDGRKTVMARDFE